VDKKSEESKYLILILRLLSSENLNFVLFCLALPRFFSLRLSADTSETALLFAFLAFLCFVSMGEHF
jgi:hypothetical protein